MYNKCGFPSGRKETAYVIIGAGIALLLQGRAIPAGSTKESGFRECKWQLAFPGGLVSLCLQWVGVSQMTSVEFHARIKSLAKMRHIKIKEIEEFAGLRPDTIRSWKKFYPAADKLVKVAEKLQTSVDYLLGVTDCPLPTQVGFSDTTTIILDALGDKKLTPKRAQAIAIVVKSMVDMQD